ncbi:MAG: hypothetical protein OXS50_01735 [Gammaproteobacteria bacterium]|nr:hypothetical protein [Gammaproteobacteria bacterium]
MSLSIERHRTLEQVGLFLDGSAAGDFEPDTRGEAYAFVQRTLRASTTGV